VNPWSLHTDISYITCTKTDTISGLAFRHCMEDGKWFRHPESGLSWSNYTTCVDMEDLEVQMTTFTS
jgi:hypothetical protein